MSEPTLRHRIFLSHNAGDKSLVRRLANDLRERGVDVWLDEWEIRVGESLRQKIEQGIQESAWLAIVLSPRSVQSEWVQRELSAAFALELAARRVVILPVLVEDCEIPLLLRDKKYADFRSDYVSGFQDLLKTLGLNTKPGSTAPFGELFDANAHLWHKHFEQDLKLVVERAYEAGVATIIASGCNGPYSWSRCIEISARYPGVYVSLAAHPIRGTRPTPFGKLDSPSDAELELLGQLLVGAKVVGIGDVQLQYDNCGDVPRDRQLDLFRRQFGLAATHNLPVLVEVYGGTDAESDFLKVMDSGYQDRVQVAVQSVGGLEFALQCRDRGYYLVVAGNVAILRAQTLRQILDLFPSNRLLLASDCPALAPPPFRGQRNEPAWIAQTIAALRDLCSCNAQELARVSTENAKQFFRLETERYPRPKEGPGLSSTFG